MKSQEEELGNNDLRENLLRSHASGTFLSHLCDLSMANRDERLDLALEVAALHNEGLLDVLAAFESLKLGASVGSDFYFTRHVLDQALPHINSDTKVVMRCVLRLYRESGDDMAAGGILESFGEFCARDASRPSQALAAIEAESSELVDLLLVTIIAGSRIDGRRYLAEAIRLCDDERIDIRRRAVRALGKLELPTDDAAPDLCLDALARVVESEEDDRILGDSIRSAFELWQKIKSQDQRVVALIRAALDNGGEQAVHAASDLFGSAKAELSESLNALLMKHLLRVKAQNNGTLRNIDYGVTRLLKSDKPLAVIAFLEELLLANGGRVSMEVFHHTAHAVAQDPSLLATLTTRWLLKGNRVLCRSIVQIVQLLREPVELSIDPAQLMPREHTTFIFLARKAIGYLMVTPQLPGSVIVALMALAPERRTISDLQSLLYEHVLLNHPDIAGALLAKAAREDREEVKGAMSSAVESLEGYLEMLRTADDVRELHVCEEHREAYMRHFGRLVAESHKQAEEKSILHMLASKSVLLYGRRSIARVLGPGGETRRVEIPLTGFSTKIALPRMHSIDPVGLEYTSRMFQVEQLQS